MLADNSVRFMSSTFGKLAMVRDQRSAVAQCKFRECGPVSGKVRLGL